MVINQIYLGELQLICESLAVLLITIRCKDL